MKKRLPVIFVNEIKKRMDNNNSVFYSAYEIKEESKPPIDNFIKEKEQIMNEEIDINQKIDEMFNSPNYVYKMGVTITMMSGEELKKEVIGRINNKLITIDDDFIAIDEIKDINY